MQKKKWEVAVSYVLIALILFAVVFPFYWMINLSLQKTHRTLSFYPKSPTISNYVHVLVDTPLLSWYLNTLLVAVVSTVLAILIGTLAGFALSRFNFRGKMSFAVVLISTQTLPRILLLIPLYIVFFTLRLINNHMGLSLSYLTITLPFATWMLWGYFLQIPTELEESGRIDGCSRVGALVRIILPMAAPGIVAVGIFAFVLAWQEYIYPLAFMSSEKFLTITVGASRFVGHEYIVWGPANAMAVLCTLPIVLLFAYVQRHMVAGLTLGAIK